MMSQVLNVVENEPQLGLFFFFVFFNVLRHVVPIL